VNQLYGESDNAFDYDKAPPKGYLKDKRDFTQKPVYKKYYEDPNDPQPYAV
jgi:small subunit ribosomal protein S17